jgi:hypothetical protein
MPFVRCLLCLAVLTSSVGFAQTPEEVPPSSRAQTPSPTPPPLVPAPEEPEHAPPQGESIPYQYQPQHQPMGTTGRIFFEVLAGAGTGAVAGFAGAVPGLLSTGANCDFGVCLITVVVPMTVAIVLGTPLGVYGAGRGLGARGSYLASLIGTMLGSIAGLLGAATAAAIGSEILTALTLFAGPVAGAVVGFEVSHASAQSTPPAPPGVAAARSSVQLVPVVGLTRTGGILGGLAGRF